MFEEHLFKKATARVPEIDRTEAFEIRVADRDLEVTAVDPDGRAFRLRFQTYQAVKVTTIDCWDADYEHVGEADSAVEEVLNSPWISDLKKTLQRVDRGATFLEKSHHFLVQLPDNVLEVVAWEMNWSWIG